MVRQRVEHHRARVPSVSDLAELVRDRPVMLLDFDGPVCSVFAGYPAHVIAAELREVIDRRSEAGRVLPYDDDPLRLLFRFASVAPPAEVRPVADALRDRELRAIESARETPGAGRLIEAASSGGRSLAIVSNNAEAAVRLHLVRRGLVDRVAFISARYDGMDPVNLKPAPYLLRRALDALGETPGRALIVGDSASDVEAAEAAGMLAVGYANRASKRQILTDAGAAAVVDDLEHLVAALV